MQKLFKHVIGYYELHKQELLAAGYVITQDTEEYTLFEKTSKSADEDEKAVQNGTEKA